MQYETKFNYNNPVCFKDGNHGLKKGVVVGINITDKWCRGDKVPSSYELGLAEAAPVRISYNILVKTSHKDGYVAMEISQDRVANTFEEAWALP